MVKKVNTTKKLPLIQSVVENWNDKNYCHIAVEKDPESFQRCEYQDEKLIKRAVFLDLQNLQFVQDKFLTHSYALQIVKKQPEAIQYLPKRLHTRAIIFEVLKQNPELVYFLNGNETYQLKAVDYNGLVLKYCNSPTKKVIKTALTNNGEAIQFVNADANPVEYYGYAVLAVKTTGSALRFVDKRIIDKTLCFHAINNDPMSLEYVPVEIKPDVELKAQTLNTEASIYAKSPQYEACKFACYIHRENILYFKKPIIDKILKEINYKNESPVLRIKIFLTKLGLNFTR